MTRVSIIIVTYNRAEFLEQLLASLDHLTHDRFEVVVVNGPSTDGTADVLREYADRVKAIAAPVGRMTAQRNLGLAAASGDVVVFIDDDARPAEPDWLDRIVEVFDADRVGRVGAVAGPALHHDSTLYQFESGMTSDYALQVFWGSQPGAPEPDGRRWVRRTVGCNSAFRRVALVDVGGFDENVLYYADEADVCFRLAMAGYETVPIPRGAVRHYPSSAAGPGGSLRRNHRVITRDDAYYCMKNGSGSLLRRLVKTVALLPRKHYVADVRASRRAGTLGAIAFVRYFLIEWIRGLAAGLWRGLGPRRLMRPAPPPPFVPFAPARPARQLAVALVTDRVPPYDGIGGVERYTYDLAKALHRLGHEVHVLCRGDFGIRRDGLGFTVHGISGEAIVGQMMFPDRPAVNHITAFGAAVSRKLLGLARDGVQIDVVHATNWNLSGVPLAIGRFHPFVLMLVTPLAEIIDTQGWTIDEGMRAYLALDRWQIEHADVVCSPSRGVLEVYREKMGLDPDRLPALRRTPLGVAPFRRHRVAPPATGRRRLLFVGRLEYRKGTHVLLEALPDLLVRHPDWQCDLVGDDCGVDGTGRHLKEQFLRRHAGAPWRDRVHFHGTVSDEALAGFYAACDVFVAPSLFESFGLIYPEAMQYGKPVVGCRSAGIPELVTDGVDGLLVEPGSVPALSAALDRLMGDDELRQRLGEAGRAKVARELDHLAMARRLIPVYEEVMARTGERARARLEQQVVSAIPVRDPDEVRREGVWVEREVRPGETYLMAERPGAALRFEVPGGSVLSLVTLRHDWSGVLAVAVDGQPPVYLDLFKRQAELVTRRDLRIPGRPAERVSVCLRVQPWRNVESHSSQIWIRQVFLRAAAGSAEDHP